ncbi:endonuclease domain-containing protein [Brachybacterium sp. GCM10030268]|uniref:endonuclease domain-containing protein n=1 Tax=Brachybacterium sp. GCM10030268 TaxID=3273382 RepID=UPI00360EBB4E
MDPFCCTPHRHGRGPIGIQCSRSSWRSSTAPTACLDTEGVAITLESGLNRGLIDETDVEDALAGISERKRRAILPLRRGAQSGTETRVYRALSRRASAFVRKPTCRPWVEWISSSEMLIIECDSTAFHSSPKQVEEDCRRDLAARALGMTVIRLSYHQIMDDWEATLDLVLEAVRRGEHRRSGIPGDLSVT